MARLFDNRHMLVPMTRLAARYYEDDGDLWSHIDVELGPEWFGSRFDFWRYLEGTSSVEVRDVDGICEWLTQCEYVSDSELFQESDYWQHPLTFEQLRKGDCEDHALWAWRKLGELGLSARFYVGRWQWDPKSPTFHAWVVFDDDEGQWLLEATARELAVMKRPFYEAKADYRPHMSIGHYRDARAYGGWVEYEVWRREQKKNGERPPVE